jgi:lysophospholipase L1-like esterase
MKRVILIGDSIRMGYEATVRSRLADVAEVVAPKDNGATSDNVVAHLAEWALSRPADVIHVNCGLHDIKTEFGQDACRIPLDAYAANVRHILLRLRNATDAAILWASSTPVNEVWHNALKPFARHETDVVRYNAAAAAVAGELDIEVNDLFTVVTDAGRDELLMDDGVHFEPPGCELLGQAVAMRVRKAMGQ